MTKYEEMLHALSERMNENEMYQLNVVWEYRDHTWLPMRDNPIIAILSDPYQELYEIVNAGSMQKITPKDFFAETEEDIKGYWIEEDRTSFFKNSFLLSIMGDD